MKRKVTNKWQWASALVTMALLTACQQDMTEDVMVPEASKQMNVIVTAQQGGGVDSRISYTPQAGVDGTSVTVRWEGNESIAYSYYDEVGVHLGVLPAIENSLSDDGKKQKFGGEFNLNNGVNETWHYVFYPVPWDSWITKDNTEKTLTIRYPMNNQVQDCTPGNETKHLEAYNIMWNMSSTIETGNAAVSFQHSTSLLYMDLTLPEANTINSIKLVSEQAMFGTEHKMAFKLDGAFLDSSTDDDKKATNVTLTLCNDTEDTSVKGYLMLTTHYVGERESATFHVEATAADGSLYISNNITVSRNGYLFEAGQCKTLKCELERVIYKTAEQAVKGDLAMADGTFISIDDLTDDQKADVRGIVFWTTADMNPDPVAQTPARLTDDKIMKANFPNCTHGLIVALKDLSTSTQWQSAPTCISDWQISTGFTAEDKELYWSIATGYDITPDPLDYILGYQNTKLLKAYNASLSDNASANKVLPVFLLDEFSINNSAPDNTTGWYIPSLKELTLMSGVDVDNLYDLEFGSETLAMINEILKVLYGVDTPQCLNRNYWSSTTNERLEPWGQFINETMGIHFNNVLSELFNGARTNSPHVRAVCAF